MVWTKRNSKPTKFFLLPSTHDFKWQKYGLESISIEVDKFAVSNPQLFDLGSKPQFSSVLSFVEKLLLSTFFAFSGKPQKIMEGLPVVRANWLKRAGCRFSPQ